MEGDFRPFLSRQPLSVETVLRPSDSLWDFRLRMIYDARAGHLPAVPESSAAVLVSFCREHGYRVPRILKSTKYVFPDSSYLVHDAEQKKRFQDVFRYVSNSA